MKDVRCLFSCHDGSIAADARLFRWVHKRIDDGRRQALGAKLCSIEGECREVAGSEVRGLCIGRIGLDEAGIIDSAAKENDCVPESMTLNLVTVQVNALACGELCDEDKWLEGEALIVSGVLVARHLLRKGAVGVDLGDGLLVRLDAEAEERIVCGGNPDGSCGERAPIVVIVVCVP